MTKEQFKVLEKHSELLFSVARTLTLFAPDPAVIQELYDVYVKLGYRQSNMACNECRIGMLLTLNRLYEENKGKYVKSDKNGESNSKRAGGTPNAKRGGNKKA